MDTASEKQKEYLTLLNTYPSPHNGQPIRLKQVDSQTFELYFERERGLQATDVSFIFSFVSMGVFVAFAQACGVALGHTVTQRLSLPNEHELHGAGVVTFGELSVQWNTQEPDEQMKQAIIFRQTSRRKYTTGLDQATAEQLTAHAKKYGMQLSHVPPDKTLEVMWLNQRAVFDDMFDPAVNQELDHWLRYSKRQKESKQDGLAYDCMQLNGKLMKLSVKHPGILRAPGLSKLIKKYYLRTMQDDSDVFYVLAPFSTEEESYNVGVMVGELWLNLSREGYYIHPFGTIMSNHAAHHDFLRLVGVTNENLAENHLVFIFRAGRSDKPVASLRLPYDKHLIME